MFTIARVVLTSTLVFYLINNAWLYLAFGVIVAGIMQVLMHDKIAAASKGKPKMRRFWFALDAAVWPGVLSSSILRIIFTNANS